ncbi:MAG: ASKHA domain-containing protein [Eubacterium sp.]|nr:ASKHA domain-containing protein [Eubacterium sp.]
MRIHFPLLDETIELPAESKVSDACAAVDLPLNLVCGGKGKCKKCLVTIKDQEGMREVLGCMTPIAEEMEIYISRERAASQILETSANDALPFNPALKAYTLPYDKLSFPLCGYIYDGLKTLLPEGIQPLSYAMAKKLSEVAYLEDYSFLQVVCHQDEIIDLVPLREERSIYGIAFDIGTTSVVGYLYDLGTGVLRNQYSTLNKQIAFGGDVISRIDYAGESPAHLAEIHRYIIDTLTEITQNLCTKSSVDALDIYNMVLCGNSTMQHLFLEISPMHLGLAPFVGTSKESVRLSGETFGLPMNPRGIVSFMPLLGGFVGADTTAVLLGLPRDKKLRLMIDLGTNGEIAVGNADKYYVASTACGPALEGAGLTMGMRGTAGAIEKISVKDGKIQCKIIGDVPAQGFCGSGIVDAVAMLFREGAIAKRGNFIKGDALDAHPMKNRFGTDDAGQRYFKIITAAEHPEGKDIIITQKDIRSVQLAKAAIYTGCCLLAENYGLKGSDLEEIVIAGAFGNYIDVNNAQFIGLLPKIDGVPIRSIGNGAGTGAQLYLLSQEEMAVCDAIPKVTTHIELATDPKFTNAYMQNMLFGDNLMI